MSVKTKAPQISAELQQQISTLNTRIGNANLAYGDMLREINKMFNMMATTIVELQKENAELKVESKKSAKNNKVK